MQQTTIIDAFEAARILEVSPDTVRRWARNGDVKHVRLPSGRLRFEEGDIRSLLQPVLARDDDLPLPENRVLPCFSASGGGFDDAE